MHLVLDVGESGEVALLGVSGELLGCSEVGDLVRSRMPQTEGFVPLHRVVQNALTGFDHADGQPVSKSVVIQCCLLYTSPSPRD